MGRAVSNWLKGKGKGTICDRREEGDASFSQATEHMNEEALRPGDGTTAVVPELTGPEAVGHDLR